MKPEFTRINHTHHITNRMFLPIKAAQIFNRVMAQHSLLARAAGSANLPVF